MIGMVVMRMMKMLTAKALGTALAFQLRAPPQCEHAVHATQNHYIAKHCALHAPGHQSEELPARICSRTPEHPYLLVPEDAELDGGGTPFSGVVVASPLCFLLALGVHVILLPCSFSDVG